MDGGMAGDVGFDGGSAYSTSTPAIISFPVGYEVGPIGKEI